MSGDSAHGFRHALQQPGAVTFTSAGLLARLPVAMIALATVLLVSNVSGSYGYAGLLSALFAITAALVSIGTSRWADSVGQTLVLRVLAVLHSGLIVGFTASIVFVHAPAAKTSNTPVMESSFCSLIRRLGSLVTVRIKKLFRRQKPLRRTLHLLLREAYPAFVDVTIEPAGFDCAKRGDRPRIPLLRLVQLVEVVKATGDIVYHGGRHGFLKPRVTAQGRHGECAHVQLHRLLVVALEEGISRFLPEARVLRQKASEAEGRQ